VKHCELARLQHLDQAVDEALRGKALDKGFDLLVVVDQQ
jgi:hypothetical protein